MQFLFVVLITTTTMDTNNFPLLQNLLQQQGMSLNDATFITQKIQNIGNEQYWIQLLLQDIKNIQDLQNKLPNYGKITCHVVLQCLHEWLIIVKNSQLVTSTSSPSQSSITDLQLKKKSKFEPFTQNHEPVCAIEISELHDYFQLKWCGEYLLVNKNKHINMWKIPEGKKVCVLKGHTDLVACMSVSHDEAYIASGARDGELFIWDTKTFSLERKLEASGIIDAVQFSPEGDLLAAGGYGTLLVYGVGESWSMLYDFKMFLTPRNGGVYSLSFIPMTMSQRRYLIIGENHGWVHCIDIDSGTMTQVREPGCRDGGWVVDNCVKEIEVSPEYGIFILTPALSGGGSISQWKLVEDDKENKLQLVQDLDSRFSKLYEREDRGNFCIFGSLVAVCYDERRAYEQDVPEIRSLPSLELISTLPHELAFHVAFHPTGKWLATASDDCIKIWSE
jgi:hypothetical protein